MSPEAQRIAIAEACGWKFTPHPIGGISSAQWEMPRGGYTQKCPDYTNNLNAMHEAEKVLTREQRDAWADELYTMLPCDENCGPIDMDDPSAGDVMVASMFQVAHASAAQRAEAFLRTLGKWTDSP